LPRRVLKTAASRVATDRATGLISGRSLGTVAAVPTAMRLSVAIALASVTLSACAGVVEEGAPGPDGGGSGSGEVPEMSRAVDIEGPAVLPHVQKFADLVCGSLDACHISTYAGHHPTASRALDILASDVYGRVPSDNNALGDAVADFVLAHQESAGIMYVIWRQRYNDGSGWDPMEDRGSITQNHYDHVHVSFEETGP
jgi:hypothetical protein